MHGSADKSIVAGMVLLRGSHLAKHYGAETVLEDVSIEVRAGEKVGLIAANGCGKSTLIRLLTKAEDCSAGTVTLDANVRLALVPQHLEFDPAATVRDVATGSLESAFTALREAEDLLARATDQDMEKALAHYQRARDRYDEVDGDAADANATRALQQVRLAERADLLAAELSGGQQNMLAIAAAISQRPNLLIMTSRATTWT